MLVAHLMRLRQTCPGKADNGTAGLIVENGLPIIGSPFFLSRLSEPDTGLRHPPLRIMYGASAPSRQARLDLGRRVNATDTAESYLYLAARS